VGRSFLLSGKEREGRRGVIWRLGGSEGVSKLCMCSCTSMFLLLQDVDQEESQNKRKGKRGSCTVLYYVGCLSLSNLGCVLNLCCYFYLYLLQAVALQCRHRPVPFVTTFAYPRFSSQVIYA